MTISIDPPTLRDVRRGLHRHAAAVSGEAFLPVPDTGSSTAVTRQGLRAVADSTAAVVLGLTDLGDALGSFLASVDTTEDTVTSFFDLTFAGLIA